MKTIFTRARLRGRQIVLLSALILAAAVGEMMLPSLLAQMINSGVAEGSESMIVTFALVMAGITVLACTVNYLGVRIAARISTDLRPGCGNRSLKRYRAFPRRSWTGSARPAWSPGAHRISPMCRTFLPCC